MELWAQRRRKILRRSNKSNRIERHDVLMARLPVPGIDSILAYSAELNAASSDARCSETRDPLST